MIWIGGWQVYAKHLETQDIYVLIQESTTAEIRTEQNYENKNEQFKILKNKVKFESSILITDRISPFA